MKGENVIKVHGKNSVIKASSLDADISFPSQTTAPVPCPIRDRGLSHAVTMLRLS